MTLGEEHAPAIRAFRRSVLLFLCLLVAFGAAAALIVDSLDGDDDDAPGGELSVLLLDVPGLLPPPAVTIRIPACRSAMRPAHAAAVAPPSLRAPPAL